MMPVRTPLWRRIFEERKRVLLPLVIVLVTNGAALVLAVLPLKTAVASSESASINAMKDLGEARRLDRQVSQARVSKDHADQELRRFYTEVLPHDFPTAQKTITLWLTDAASEAGLQFKTSHLDWSEVHDSRLSRAFLRVTLEGSYPNIRRFLYAVETAQEFIVVEKVELAQQNDQPTAGGALEVSLVVATYYTTKPAL
jgi:Tfp pilus assembly protein PilO